MLALETESRQAFELVANAVDAIDRYKRSRDRDRRTLEAALTDLEEARRHDGRYLLAPYYVAVVEELLHRSPNAAELLRALLAQAPNEPSLIHEMRFNLAVAQYHGYSHRHLRPAAETLREVLGSTNTLRDRIAYCRVRLHSLALLAQVHAMWSIPSTPEEVSANESERARIEECYSSAVTNARKVFCSPLLYVLGLTNRMRYREIKAVAYNALGMAAMYYTDFSREELPQKLDRLSGGLRNLEESEQLFSQDWANYCDIGSCHMRLAHWGNNTTQLVIARRYLTEVIERLRPEYGFALYEIGRTYRIEGCFDKALTYFERAMRVPAGDREVSDRRVNREINLAKEQNTLYP
jgi:tetratricopeptide (TPR) repeat protein